MDLLTEEDLGVIFGYVFLLVVWDNEMRNWVVCNHAGLTHAGPGSG
jgi:hypothetical protein